MSHHISPCGRFRIIQASLAGADRVLADLCPWEAEERDRVGWSKAEANKSVRAAVVQDRAWLITEYAWPWRDLALIGVGDEVMDARVRYIWSLPSRYCARKYRRALGDPRVIQWALDYLWSAIPTDDHKKSPVFMNGVTPENTKVIEWLKRVAGARFSNTPLPAGPKERPALPFFIHHEPKGA